MERPCEHTPAGLREGGHQKPNRQADLTETDLPAPALRGDPFLLCDPPAFGIFLGQHEQTKIDLGTKCNN